MGRIYFLLLAAFLAGTASALVVTQKSTADGVVVAVTAGNLEPEATVWDFAVVLRSSRGRALTDDPLTSAVQKQLTSAGVPSLDGGALSFRSVESAN